MDDKSGKQAIEYPKMDPQDYAVGRVFDYACRAAVDISPTYLTDIESRVAKVEAIAAVLREQTMELEGIGLFEHAAKLSDVIDQCEEMAGWEQDRISYARLVSVAKRISPFKIGVIARFSSTFFLAAYMCTVSHT